MSIDSQKRIANYSFILLLLINIIYVVFVWMFSTSFYTSPDGVRVSVDWPSVVLKYKWGVIVGMLPLVWAYTLREKMRYSDASIVCIIASIADVFILIPFSLFF